MLAKIKSVPKETSFYYGIFRKYAFGITEAGDKLNFVALHSRNTFDTILRLYY